MGARPVATARVDLVGGHDEAVEGGVHAADLGAVGQRDLREGLDASVLVGHVEIAPALAVAAYLGGDDGEHAVAALIFGLGRSSFAE